MKNGQEKSNEPESGKSVFEKLSSFFVSAAMFIFDPFSFLSTPSRSQKSADDQQDLPIIKPEGLVTKERNEKAHEQPSVQDTYDPRTRADAVKRWQAEHDKEIQAKRAAQTASITPEASEQLLEKNTSSQQKGPWAEKFHPTQSGQDHAASQAMANKFRNQPTSHSR